MFILRFILGCVFFFTPKPTVLTNPPKTLIYNQMIIRKKKIAEYMKVSVLGVNDLFCPPEYYVILIKDIPSGRPVDTEDKAKAIVEWFNSVDTTALTEDLLNNL